MRELKHIDLRGAGSRITDDLLFRAENQMMPEDFADQDVVFCHIVLCLHNVTGIVSQMK